MQLYTACCRLNEASQDLLNGATAHIELAQDETDCLHAAFSFLNHKHSPKTRAQGMSILQIQHNRLQILSSPGVQRSFSKRKTGTASADHANFLRWITQGLNLST